MVKKYVQLTEEEASALERLAAEARVSVAELLRRGARRILKEEGKPSREELWERASQAIGAFDSGKTDVSERHDDYLAEAYEE